MNSVAQSGIRREVWAKVDFQEAILADPGELHRIVEQVKGAAKSHAPEGSDVVFSQPKVSVPHKLGGVAWMEITGVVLAESVTMPT